MKIFHSLKKKIFLLDQIDGESIVMVKFNDYESANI